MGLHIILLGVQGAGKGVQAGFIQETYGIPQVSTGDLFRAMKTREDDFARQIQDIMARGELISDDITNQMVEERLAEPDAANGVILDGFPRNTAQADWLAEHLASKGDKVNSVLLFDLDLYLAFKRAFGRVYSQDKERVYNIFYDDSAIDWRYEDHPDGDYPPRVVGKEKSSGEPLFRRPDDANAGAIIKRIDTYLQTTMPLVDYYQKKGLLARIDASKSIEEVNQAVKRVVDASRG